MNVLYGAAGSFTAHVMALTRGQHRPGVIRPIINAKVDTW